MPVLNWNTTILDGKEWLVVDMAKFRIPLEWDPNSQMFLAIAVPDGGVGNFPALVKGDPGDTPQLDLVVDFEALEPDDVTPDYASLAETSPNVYKLSLGLHKGLKGDDGDTVLDPGDFTDPLPGQVVTLNGAGTAFVLESPKIGDSYWPLSINNTPSGNPSYTLCSVGIPAQPFAWRPEVSGWCVITGTGSDVAVNLVARLDDAAAGNIVGLGYDRIGGVSPPTHILVDGPPTGEDDDHNKVPANTAATIYLRAERRSGTQTFTTSDTTTRFKVKVAPVP